MTNEDGLLRQAAAETGAPRAAPAGKLATLGGGKDGLLVVGQILGEVLPNSGQRRQLQESELVNPELLKAGVGYTVARSKAD